MAERRWKGLCFHCNDKFGLGYFCAKLFMIEAYWEESYGDEVIEVKERTNEPEISFHVVASFQSPQQWDESDGDEVMEVKERTNELEISFHVVDGFQSPQ